MRVIKRATAKCGYPFLNIIAYETANRNKNTRYSKEYLVFILAEDEGLDLINVALRRAVARGAHPRRI